MQPFTIFCPGDEAITISLSNSISLRDNEKILAMKNWLEENKFPGLKDIVVAYSSLTVLYDLLSVTQLNHVRSAISFITDQLIKSFDESAFERGENRSCIEIPVCYEEVYGIDLKEIATTTGLSVAEVIDLHSSVTYHVYMIGFLPGFGYMGSVDKRIAVSRKKTPRANVEAGSVAIAGIQTGIYPVNSPGGWQVVGRTPMKMFDISSHDPSALQPGDKVEFYPITSAEFLKLADK